MSFGLLSVLGVGLGMGVLHALDPDHMVTMSSLGARPDSGGATRRFALSWALGHGGILVIAAIALLLFRMPLPEALPPGAERLVGVILIAAGGSLALALWHGTALEGQPSGLRRKAPFLIGMVHGTAGSAAALALLPVGLLSPVQGVVYVLVFSGGVLLGMMGFGHGFDRMSKVVAQRGQSIERALRGCIATLAICMGSYWLWSA